MDSGLVALKTADRERPSVLSVIRPYNGKCVGRMTAPDIATVDSCGNDVIATGFRFAAFAPICAG